MLKPGTRPSCSASSSSVGRSSAMKTNLRGRRAAARVSRKRGQPQIATSIRSHLRPQSDATDWVEAREEVRHVAAPNRPAREHGHGPSVLDAGFLCWQPAFALLGGNLAVPSRRGPLRSTFKYPDHCARLICIQNGFLHPYIAQKNRCAAQGRRLFHCNAGRRKKARK